MQITFTHGALLYEARTPQSNFLIRAYRTNVGDALRQGEEQLRYARKHKQPEPIMLVLDIQSGSLQAVEIYEEN